MASNATGRRRSRVWPLACALGLGGAWGGTTADGQVPLRDDPSAAAPSPGRDAGTSMASADRVPWSGTLMLCGGAALPDSILELFFQLGGGPAGRLVILPTASPRSDLVGSGEGAGGPDFSFWTDYWQRYEWGLVEVLHVPENDPRGTEGWVACLDRATAVWMAGGDQSRLSRRIRGTPVADALRRVLERGGVVAGTSAGAAICSETMISGGTRDPEFQPGFGWLNGTMIDQHFLAKRRRERLSKAVRLQGGLTGIGIDESTALVLSGSTAEVLGSGHIHFYASRPPRELDGNAVRVGPTTREGDAVAASDPDRPSRSELPDLVWSGGARIEIGRLGLFR